MQNRIQLPSCCSGTRARRESIISLVLGFGFIGGGLIAKYVEISDMSVDHDTREVISNVCYGLAGLCVASAACYYAGYKYSTTNTNVTETNTETPLASQTTDHSML